MHFGKTLDQLLQTLPEELQHVSIDYRRLKKLIRAVVEELDAAGLPPDVIHDVPLSSSVPSTPTVAEYPRVGVRDADGVLHGLHPSKLRYELSRDTDGFKPRLRVWLRRDDSPPALLGSMPSAHISDPNLLDAPPRSPTPGRDSVEIPLPADMTFYAILMSTLAAIQDLQAQVRARFATDLRALSHEVSQSARPVSEGHASDLYAWREIFRLYVEGEIFESMAERDRGERDIEESEERFRKFALQVSKRPKLKHKETRAAVEHFMDLNMLILNLKKFERANADAARKILKKHAKRTALPTPDARALVSISEGARDASAWTGLARVLACVLTDTLLPVVPGLDDYACAICTELAFRPVRLNCGHLFCVRCLVKLQKRGTAQCPMCRAPTVLRASVDNLDVALQNFMKDWFPDEVKEKVKANDRESAREELIEMGFNPDAKCVVQ